MIRLIAAATLGILLVACTPQPPEIDMSDPYTSLHPWDATRADIVTTESGLQYIVVKQGDQTSDLPQPEDRVEVMYDGRFAETGEVFDSSESSSFGVTQVIKGWIEGLQLMHVGDEFMFYIPSDLAYGVNGRPGIPPSSDLMFHVELLSIQTPPPPKTIDTAAWAKYTPWNSAHEDVIKTASGLEYVVLESGDPAGATPAPGKIVVVFYEGRFAETGEMFDSSYQRGEPILHPADGFIPGWNEALAMMHPGDHWIVHIPSELAYGEAGKGPIPPDTVLEFELELMDVL
ncbi:MAG: FKBP-type peptidyl-prolyl cis-trans isomerase [Hyphomonadaceae bacterium]